MSLTPREDRKQKDLTLRSLVSEFLHNNHDAIGYFVRRVASGRIIGSEQEDDRLWRNPLKASMFNSPEHMLRVVSIHFKIRSLASRVIFVSDIPDVFPSLRKRVAQEHEINVPALCDSLISA